jgi:hypothetical protein
MSATRSLVPGLLALAMLGVLAGTPLAAPTAYIAHLDGPSESPPNASPGTGYAEVILDPAAHTMSVHITFSGLLAPNTACHIHSATSVPGTGTAGVATTTPTFTGFPGGVTSGTYDHVFDTSLTSSFNGSFVTNNGGTAAAAEAALFLGIDQERAYVNLHSSTFTGGEIRGFLTLDPSTPTRQSTWGRLKALFR